MAKRAAEIDWETDSDARALMQAEAVRGDAGRLKKARKALDKIEADAKKTALEAQVARKLKEL
jgi:hypothetical protein